MTKSSVELAKSLPIESEKKCKELKMTGHFSGGKVPSESQRTYNNCKELKVTRNFYNDEKFRRTRKELT